MQGSGSDRGALLSWVEMSQVQQRGALMVRLIGYASAITVYCCDREPGRSRATSGG